MLSHLDRIDVRIRTELRDSINRKSATIWLIKPQLQRPFAVPDRPHPERMNLLAHLGTSFVQGDCVSVIRPAKERD